MKTMYLILTMLLLFTGCEKEEAKEEEQQDPSVIALQKIYDNSNGKGDAISITMEDLEATKVTDLIATKLPQYQTSIGAKTDFSNPVKVGELQEVVYLTNNGLIKSTGVITKYINPAFVFCECCQGFHFTIDDDLVNEYRTFPSAIPLSEKVNLIMSDIIFNKLKLPLNISLTWKELSSKECVSIGKTVYVIYIEDIEIINKK